MKRSLSGSDGNLPHSDQVIGVASKQGLLRDKKLLKCKTKNMKINQEYVFLTIPSVKGHEYVVVPVPIIIAGLVVRA